MGMSKGRLRSDGGSQGVSRRWRCCSRQGPWSRCVSLGVVVSVELSRCRSCWVLLGLSVQVSFAVSVAISKRKSSSISGVVWAQAPGPVARRGEVRVIAPPRCTEPHVMASRGRTVFARQAGQLSTTARA